MTGGDNKITTDNPANKATGNESELIIHLPFESANYERDTNFILFDSLGKRVTPTTDTVTKGGGTVYYAAITDGSYHYKLTTVFEEIITKKIQLHRNLDLYLGEDVYVTNDNLGLAPIKKAETIKIIIETETEEGKYSRYFYKAKKGGNTYSVTWRTNNDVEWGKYRSVDSDVLYQCTGHI